MDQITKKFLKETADVLAYPLPRITNLFIKLSVFPEKYEIAKIKPLFKKSSKSDTKSHRLISLRHLVSKTIEKSRAKFSTD